MRRRCAKWIISPLLLVSLLSLVSWASTKGDAAKAKEISPATAPTESAIRITLVPSREQAVASSDFGIKARVENVSSQNVYFTPRSFSLVAPPELDPGLSSEWFPLFPLIQNPNAESDKVDWEKYYTTVVVLTPGSSIPAFWNGKLKVPETSGIKGFMRGLNFTPGQYALTVTGRYWDVPDGPTNPNAVSHTQTAELQEVMGAPKITILIGAALGGLFAFLLVWKVDPSRYSGWEPRTWMGVLSSILLSIIVTILLARLSDSQFFIRVTVNDLWGAMAVGFIGAALGPTILDKFIKLFQGSGQEQDGKKKVQPAVGKDEGTQTGVVSKASNHVSEPRKVA